MTQTTLLGKIVSYVGERPDPDKPGNYVRATVRGPVVAVNNNFNLLVLCNGRLHYTWYEYVEVVE